MEVSSYDLRFDIRDDGSYDGIETVKMVCHGGEPIYLHSSGLSIGSISVNGKAVSFREDTEREMILIEGTYSGECSVSVAFSGRASETLQASTPRRRQAAQCTRRSSSLQMPGACSLVLMSHPRRQGSGSL
ncbi:hypothetical protein [Thermogymnomonas acidicola]|uniref:hypothetical protein n=1 Tax=Thermogymnomonas acidicola TaxID=399579 RepID=UPI00094659BD|nr:hypothetical protein [Thermogymnomonas acidicola]